MRGFTATFQLSVKRVIQLLTVLLSLCVSAVAAAADAAADGRVGDGDPVRMRDVFG